MRQVLLQRGVLSILTHQHHAGVVLGGPVGPTDRSRSNPVQPARSGSDKHDSTVNLRAPPGANGTVRGRSRPFHRF